jgi:hypothetical protein
MDNDADERLKAVDDAIQNLATLLAPNGALCTTWILVTEWIDTEGNFWFSTHSEPDQPHWRQTGMLDHAKTVILRQHMEMDNDENGTT